MIVKFLAKSKTFKGVRYNTNKVGKDKGELMKVSGFGSLQGMSQLLPQDYINYLNMVSAPNKRVVYPQLHAIISAKGKESSKEDLTEIAEKWLAQMGYGDQPYLIIFHKDTRNQHVHIVSTRVDKASGKKISSAFEHIRAMTAINKIMKQDPLALAKADLDLAMKYNFQTKAQFKMILEGRGYTLVEKDGKLSLIKFGRNLLEADLGFLKERKATYQIDLARAGQITALLHKFGHQHSAMLRAEMIQLPGNFEQEKKSYTSDLAIFMKQKFGIELIFHGAPGRIPYGYSILDHNPNHKNVFKGGEIMDIQDLLSTSADVQKMSTDCLETIPVSEASNIELISENSTTGHQFTNSSAHSVTGEFGFEPFEQPVQISISEDIDDEAIHGRNRHRKRQARTNTR
ncbi:relaxase/mobilization nuclease domain-containing protein [Pedobacter panaciterrae]|uniref:relaxase/mobilization nuclease domain-containing protein n=1 Tax=Pedobacter panaciterrae TaxID=363849 RepID=UPI00155DBFF6|nr:relaxase/mobilization nuclease domain-containing protein [Pedobacter panaciterrae]NQX54456.1 relaxase/mobilization nuclease domain-containing protein [Pedobacter panaciterrae]